MAWNLDKNRAICPQLCEIISVKIAKGEYAPNEKIPSVRDIAVDAGVNPNTVQKALTLLTEQGLIYPMRGSGMYVNDNIERAVKLVDELKAARTAAFFEEMETLGLSVSQVKEYIKEWEQ